MDHLKEARANIFEAEDHPASDWVRAYAQLATAHAQIALVELLAERLPPIAETASECGKRLREEEKNDGV